MGLHRTSVRGVIHRFLERGKIDIRSKIKPRNTITKTSLIQDYLQDEQRLQDWSCYTCKERCVLIEKELGVKIHHSYLRQIYLKLNIKYRLVKREPLCANYDTIDQRRIDYSQKLAQIIASGEPVVYMDETTFHYHLRQNRSWSKANQKVVFPYNQFKFKSVTLLGAIGNGLREPVFMTARSTDQYECFTFFQKLTTKLADTFNMKSHLILDGHKAHFTKENRKLLEQHFQLLQMPASSCEFNSIECLWSNFKQKFKKNIVAKVGKIHSQEQLDQEVKRAVASVPITTVNKYITANRGHILKYLQKHTEKDQ